MTQRKVIQIATDRANTLALCDDGTLWRHHPISGKWDRLPDIPQDHPRRSAIDIMDDVLRPALGSMAATSAAVTCWHALRREGYEMTTEGSEG